MFQSLLKFFTWSRIVFFSLALLLASLPAVLFIDFLGRTGIYPPKIVLSALFVVLIAYVAWGASHAIIGFVIRRLGARRGQIEESIADLQPGDTRLPPVALVIPVYNEEPMRVFAGLRAMYESLLATGQGESFDIFILSDSNDSERWAFEEELWATLCRDLNAYGRINYRRRRINKDRKAGNLMEFCEDWGGRYRYMVTMDADSVMAGGDLVKLAQIMERNPRVGICQTAPRLALGESLWGRLQQFSNRFYGPIFMDGLNFWQREDGNYWGHNAIIRLAPFMEHCALPDLPGKEPFGGKILSHDFVEAALMRRAGYEVWLAGRLEGSYEEGPQDLIEYAKRDRRWCQGNLQHFWLLTSPALLPGSRTHLANGILGYCSSLVWLCFLVMGGVVAFNWKRSHLSLLPETGFANVLRLDIQSHAVAVSGITFGLLFLPKLLALIDTALDSGRRRRFGGLRNILAGVLLESAFSVLVAPILMIYHSRFVFATAMGKGVAWVTQKRDAGDGIALSDAIREHWSQTVIGAVFAVLSAQLSDSYFWWLSPVWFGLMISPLLSFWLSKPSLGKGLANRGILSIPEERAQPEALTNTLGYLREFAAQYGIDDGAPFPGFRRVVADPYANAIRLALIDENDRGANEAIKAKAHSMLKEGVAALEKEERRAILCDPDLLLETYRAVWTMDPAELHDDWKRSIARYER